jgi:predicted alpha/beta superfamily hydrolase
MKQYLLSLLMICGFVSYSQNRINITFEVIAKDLPGDATVYVTGSSPVIGSWNPEGLPLKYQGNDTWLVTVSLPNPSNIEYKFTKGSWANQAADENGFELQNFNAKLDKDQTLSHTLFGWTDGVKRVNKGQIAGTVKYHPSVKGEGLKDRNVVVWLPPGYENSSERYPVLYMHDGRNVFDPATSAFGVDWAVDETLDSLIRGKHIPPMIVVGLDNTDDRTLEYSPGEKGTAYMNLITQVIKPLIDQTYRTKTDSDNTFVGGSSMGGIISFMIVWTHPDIFSKAICMSPAFKSPEGYQYYFDFVKTVIETDKRKKVKFYIDNGGIGLESELQPGIDEMIEALKAKKYKEGKDYLFVLEEAASHNEAAWAQRFPTAILWLVK